jgi:hypothetical protein
LTTKQFNTRIDADLSDAVQQAVKSHENDPNPLTLREFTEMAFREKLAANSPPGQGAASPYHVAAAPRGADTQEDKAFDLSRLTDADLKRELSIRKDKRDQEQHEIDLKLKRVKLIKQTPQSVTRPCPIGGCAADKQGLTFKNQEELEEHYWLAHRDKLAEVQGKEAGKWR